MRLLEARFQPLKGTNGKQGQAIKETNKRHGKGKSQYDIDRDYEQLCVFFFFDVM